MNYYIGCDAHKKYSVFVMVSDRGAYCVKIKCYRKGFNCLINHVTETSQVLDFLC